MKRNEKQELIDLREKTEKRKQQIRKANATYNEKIERINLIVPIGTKEKIATKAKTEGITSSEYLRNLVLKDLYT